MDSSEIFKLVQAGTRVSALSAEGAVVPMPADLAEFAESADLVGHGALDAIDPSSHGPAIAAFEQARRTGHGTATIQLSEQPGFWRFEIIDAREPLGCLLAISNPVRSEKEVKTTGSDLHSRTATATLDPSGMFLSINSDFTTMLGWTEDQIVGNIATKFIHPDDHDATFVHWIDVLSAPGNRSRILYRFKTAAGNWLWCEVTNINRLDCPDNPRLEAHLLDMSREMAAQAKLQRRETLLNRLAQALPTGVLFFDETGEVSITNERWQQLTGTSADDNLDELLKQIDEAEIVEQALHDAARSGIDADIPITFGSGSGACRYGLLHLRPIVENGCSNGLLVTLDDATDTRTLQNKLADQSRRDSLTGLYNRLGIEEIIAKRIAVPTEGQVSQFALIFIDLDQFKPINDNHGHHVGDQVLKAVATALDESTRDSDAVGRIGGDEFIVFIANSSNVEHVKACAARVRHAIGKANDTFSPDIEVSGTVGYAISQPGENFEMVLQRSDAAMYARKAPSTR